MPFIPKYIIRSNKTTFAILLFLVIFSAIHAVKPSLLYMEDGSFRPFGVGYKQKTVIPIWLVAIFLAILSYLSIIAYLLWK